MLEQGAGVIVNVASVAGLVGLAGKAHYAASKHGVVGLTRTAALDYAKDNIRVNAVCPGPVLTPMNDKPASLERYRQMIPTGRMGEPREIARCISWLCSDDTSFMTGAVITIDGGVTAC